VVERSIDDLDTEGHTCLQVSRRTTRFCTWPRSPQLMGVRTCTARKRESMANHLRLSKQDRWLHFSKAKSCFGHKCRPTQFRFAWLEHSAQAEIMHGRGYWRSPYRSLSVQVINESNEDYQANDTTFFNQQMWTYVGATFCCALESRLDPQTTHTLAARYVTRKRIFCPRKTSWLVLWRCHASAGSRLV
jgi:hypothetical protein